MKKIIFHIGLHKTGSTALQNFLWNHRHQLEKFGLIYPEVGVNHFAHQNIAFDLNQDNRFNQKLGGFTELTDFCNTISKGIIVVSSERLEFCQKKSIQKISQLLNGEEIEIIVYLRRQDEFLQSEYTQLVKHGFCTLNFEDFLNKNLHSKRLQYIDYLQKWINVFGRNSIKVRVFEKSRLVNQNIIYDFLSLFPNYESTKILADSYKDIPRNSKPAYEILELIRRLAQTLVDKQLMNRLLFSKKIAQPILKCKNVQNKYVNSFNKLTPEIQTMIINHFRSHNQSLVSLLSEDLVDKSLENAFSTNVNNNLITEKSMSIQEYTNILSEVGLSPTLLHDTVNEKA